MESSNKYNSGRSSACPDAARLWKYAHGKLPAAELFEVEHHALDCPLCAAAVEGYATVDHLPDLNSGRRNLFKGRNSWWTMAGIGFALLGILWAGGLFREAQRSSMDTEPLPPEDLSAPVQVQAKDTVHDLKPDSVTLVDVRNANPAAVSGERIRRWGDELFMIEKRGVENVPLGSVKAGVKGKSRMELVYIEGLKVAAYSDRLNGDGNELEVARSLHPRYANDHDRKGESFYSDTDTIRYRDLLTDALRAFNYGRCNQVLGQLKSIGDKYPDDQNVWFYSGMCAKNNGRADDAISFFATMVADESSPFHEEAMWHTALCFEQSGDMTNAMKFFRRIAEGDGFYAEAASRKL